jgi:hypothetical protein
MAIRERDVNAKASTEQVRNRDRSCPQTLCRGKSVVSGSWVERSGTQQLSGAEEAIHAGWTEVRYECIDQFPE